MRFTIDHCIWDVNVDPIKDCDAYENELKRLGLPNDDFSVEIDYELEDEDEGPTEEEMMEIDDILAEAIYDKYNCPIVEFSWDVDEY